MIDREEVLETLRKYDGRKIGIGCIGSHSALNISEGASTEGFKTYVFCQSGRERTYARYFKSVYHNGKRVKGVVDDAIVLPRFHDVMSGEWQDFIVKNSILWIPNRSFWVYCGKTEIQEEFNIPMVGSRHLLHLEDREEQREFNYYHVLEQAGIRAPASLSEDEIDGLVMVKVPHAIHKLERGFFTARSKKEFNEKIERLKKRKIIAEEDIASMRIEKYCIGPVCNANFFYSPINKEMDDEPLELMSTEWRFESNLDGFVRLPVDQQPSEEPTYIVVGHSLMTLRESLIEKFFDMADKFVRKVEEISPPGIIGPFGLQCVIEDDMKPTCYDVAFRIPGGDDITGYWGHVYLNTLWHQRMSTGRRLSLEIKRAIDCDLLEMIVT